MMRKTCIKLFLFCVVAFTTLVILLYLQPCFFKLFPSSNKRYAAISEILGKSDDNIIIFGDSRTVLGINALKIKGTPGINKEVYNAGAYGLSPYQFGYFYTSISSNTKVVVQCLSQTFMTEDLQQKISKSEAIPIFLSGFKPNDETKLLVENYNHFFDNSDFRNLYESRVYFRNYLTSVIRPVFDNERFNESINDDLYFPHIYTQNRSPDFPVFKTGCKKYRTKNNPSSQLAFLKKVNSYFSSKGIKYIIAIMPVNPEDCNSCYHESEKAKHLIAVSTGVDVINMSGVLRKEHFYDAYHPNRDGAVVLSEILGEELSVRVK